MAEIVKCGCRHEGQDAIYGYEKRVANLTAEKSGRSYRCTVCEKIHTVGSAPIEPKKAKGEK